MAKIIMEKIKTARADGILVSALLLRHIVLTLNLLGFFFVLDIVLTIKLSEGNVILVYFLPSFISST